MKNAQIKRMQEMLTEMKEKLQVNTELESHKHDSIIEV